MFIVLYRWRVKPEFETQFVESWSEITDYLREKHDSLGSRLHRGNDGVWYGYAQWKSVEQRERAFASESEVVSEASRKMREAIAESFPEIILDVMSDYLVLPEKK
jgi:Antibiotic biosynthesis monooxygenase